MTNDDEKKRLMSIFEVMVDGVYMVDRDFNVEYMNDTMAKDFGPGIGKKCHHIFHGSESLCDWCRAEQVFAGKTIRVEQYIKSVDRTYDIIEFPLKHSDGTLSKVSIFRDMSQIKEREEMIRMSKDRYHELFENIRSGIYESTKEGRFVDANRALLEMLGYENKEEFLEINIERDLYLRPEDRGKFQKMIERDEYVTNYEVDFKNKKGERVPVSLTSHVRRDLKGQVIGYEGIIVDQTQRKQIEEDYRRLFEHVGCGVFISSKEGKFLNANQALLDMLGFGSKEDFLKIDISRDLYLRPEDRREFQKMIAEEGHVIDYEVEFKRKDGTPIPVLLAAHARHDQQGNIIGYEGINVDLSHRNQMEKQLKEAHDLLDRIIKSSPNAIIATDMEGNIIIWNRGAEEILGYKAEEVIGKMHISRIYPEGMAKQVMKMMRSNAYGGLGRLRSYPIVQVRRDGEIVEGNLSSAILYDGRGNEVASVGIFTDLNERLEMERRLMDTQVHWNF
ncbi:MAG: PAS domain S-box protein [Deltaproteobacteria bacterium]|nr:PAS domain S-box protein [Deltaproteobacteria bacterium]